MLGPLIAGRNGIQLRPLTLEDQLKKLEWFALPETSRFWGPRAGEWTKEKLEERYKHDAEDRNSISWSIAYEGEGVGFTGIFDIDWVRRDGDSGLSGRVYSMLAKEMSDTRNRGRILWVFATSRPDLVEVDLKRQGRLDVHIPLFPPETAAERELCAARDFLRWLVQGGFVFLGYRRYRVTGAARGADHRRGPWIELQHRGALVERGVQRGGEGGVVAAAQRPGCGARVAGEALHPRAHGGLARAAGGPDTHGAGEG